MERVGVREEREEREEEERRRESKSKRSGERGVGHLAWNICSRVY